MNKDKLQTATFYILLVTLCLIVIVAIGNWNLYSRVERIENILLLPAKQQSLSAATTGYNNYLQLQEDIA